MKTVREVSEISKVSVRTLHYYDEIGLLKPSGRTQSGYRLYDDTALARLGQILLYRELEFSLEEIRSILSQPDFERMEALRQQEKMLKLRRERLTRLIGLAQTLQKEEVQMVNFEAFDKSELEQYEQEVRSRFGESPAYEEYVQKTKHYKKEQWQAAAEGLWECFSAFEELVGQPPEAETVQKQVAALQQSITQNYYCCTNEMLASLGQMYVLDERFLNNIDCNKQGTAKLVSEAIAIYCKKN